FTIGATVDAPAAGVSAVGLAVLGSPGAHPTLAFESPPDVRASLRLYDLAGRRVRTLFDGIAPAGARVRWDGRHDRGELARARGEEAQSGGRMFEGLSVAMVTPFKDGALDEPAAERMTEFLIQGGVDGLVVLGTTGEGPVVTREERSRLYRLVQMTAAGRARL